MDKIKLIEPPAERFSWAKEILKLNEEGDKFKARKQFSGSIAPVISRDIRLKAPDREYSIDTTTEPDYIIITLEKLTNEELEKTTN